MALFTYTAKEKSGKVKRGEINAANKNEAAELLISKELIPVGIATKKEGESPLDKIKNFSIIPRMEKVAFARQLSTLINAGVPLVKALNILTKQIQNKKLALIVSAIQTDVEGGSTLSEAMSKHEKVFGSIFISMVNSGEIGGILDQALDKSATQLEKEHEIISKIRGAMIYPSVILVAMTGAVIFMMVSVVPVLAKMFEDMDAELPITTKILISISESMTTYGIIAVFSLAGFVFLFRYLMNKIYPFKKAVHFLMLKTPLIGKAIQKVTIIRFTNTLSSLMESGISIVDIIDIIAKATPNVIYKEEITSMSDKVKNGLPLSKAMEECKNFPYLVSQMVSVGEESGELSQISERIAGFYEKEIDNLIKNLTSIIEPFLMLLIGGMIGFIMFSIIKPIYQLTDMF